MSEFSPIIADQKKIDEKHLRLLSILYYVLGFLVMPGILCLIFYFIIHQSNSPHEVWKYNQAEIRPYKFFRFFEKIFLQTGLFSLVFSTINILSARFIAKRTKRAFSLAIAGLHCILFPFGTALGIFSFVVLTRDSVKEVYDSSQTL